MWHSSREARKEDRSRCLLAADRKPAVDQRKVTAKVLLGEPVSATGVAYKNTGEGLFTGAEKTLRYLYSKAHSAWPGWPLTQAGDLERTT